MTDTRLLHSITQGFDTVVRDPVWGDIQFDESLSALSKLSAFGVLDGIRQLGPTSRLYPGATHSRYSHSLGVYHLARRMVISLLERNQLPNATPEGLKSFLAAALCHDLGHYPYAHSLKELPLAAHETIAAEMVQRDDLGKAILECGADPAQVGAIIDSDRLEPLDRETLLYRRVLSGVLDPDKIDYLTRDAYFCGVPYGVQDAEYILRRIFVDDGRLTVDEKGLTSVEAVLFSKYQMYRTVYWHPSVRAATAMVKKSVLMAMSRSSLPAEQLYGLDDRGFRSLVENGDHELFACAQDAFRGMLYQPVCDIRYDPESAVHSDLDDLDRRTEAEAALAMAADLRESDVIIDIPEPIGFETDLGVRADGRVGKFTELTSLFSAVSVGSLTSSLRRIRIYLHPRVDRKSVDSLARELLA